MLNRHCPPHGAAPVRLAFALAALLSAGLLAAPAIAQSPLGIGVAEPSVATGGTLGKVLAVINAEQQRFYRAMTEALKAMRTDPWKLSGLVLLSFLYGVFHAAGPGHGKAVISSYMIANEVALRRGVMLSFVSALLQGLVAIVLVGSAFLVLRGSGIRMTEATKALETASFALVAAFGAWLLWKKLAALPIRSRLIGRTPSSTLAAATLHEEAAHARAPDRAPDRDAGHHDCQHRPGHAHDHGHGHGHHAHAHGSGGACPDCGHSHVPDPALLSGDRLRFREAVSAVVAVGLRPCSGALVVLTFALLNGLYAGGVLSVLAMSVGTAITVSVLATLAVGAKGLAVRLAGEGTAGRATASAIEIAGAAFVLVLGLLLLGASLQG